MNTNLLDLNNDVLNIIGRYVKKDNLEKLFQAEQIINGKKIRFDTFSNYVPGFIIDENHKYIKDINTIPKDSIKRFIFFYIDCEIMKIKKYAKTDKIKLSKLDIRMCIWVCIQRSKYMLNRYKIYLNKENQNKEFLNMEDENNYLDEYFTLNKLNLKSKKYSFNY